MEYYVIYEIGIGYNIYSEVELDLMDLDYCTTEFWGTKEECIEYLNNIE